RPCVVLVIRPLPESGRRLLAAALVNGADSRQPLFQRQLEAPRECRRLGHHASVAPVRFHADKRRQAKYAGICAAGGLLGLLVGTASWWVGGPVAVIFFTLTVLLVRSA